MVMLGNVGLLLGSVGYCWHYVGVMLGYVRLFEL